MDAKALEDFIKRNPNLTQMLSTYVQNQTRQFQPTYPAYPMPPNPGYLPVDFNQYFAASHAMAARSMVPQGYPNMLPMFQHAPQMEHIEPRVKIRETMSETSSVKAPLESETASEKDVNFNRSSNVLEDIQEGEEPAVLKKLLDKLQSLRQEKQVTQEPTDTVDVSEVTKQELEEKKKRHEELQQKVRNLQDEIGQEEAEFNQICSRVTTHNETAAEISSSLQELVKKINSMQLLLTKNQEKLVENQKAIADLSRKGSDLCVSITSKRQRIIQLLSEDDLVVPPSVSPSEGTAPYTADTTAATTPYPDSAEENQLVSPDDLTDDLPPIASVPESTQPSPVKQDLQKSSSPKRQYPQHVEPTGPTAQSKPRATNVIPVHQVNLRRTTLTPMHPRAQYPQIPFNPYYPNIAQWNPSFTATATKSHENPKRQRRD